MRLIKERGLKSALVLEDDIDFEWDLERLWNRIRLHVTEEWDMVYFGRLTPPSSVHSLDSLFLFPSH